MFLGFLGVLLIVVGVIGYRVYGDKVKAMMKLHETKVAVEVQGIEKEIKQTENELNSENKEEK